MSTHPLGIRGIHHVSLRVSDFDRSLAFYQGTLGLPLRVSFELGGRRFALLDTGNAGHLELVESKTPVQPTGAAEVAWHFALRTDRIEAAVAAAAAAGCTITKPVTEVPLTNSASGKPFPIRIAFFRGFDGEEVEFFEDKTGQS